MLSNEQLKQRIAALRKDAKEVKWMSVESAQSVLAAADALEELLHYREARPVFFIDMAGGDWINVDEIPGNTFDFNNLPDGINFLYTAPPAPAVPDEMTGSIAMTQYGIKPSNYKQWVKGYNACRAAILAAVPGGKE